MEQYKILLTDPAEADLDAITQYIAVKLSAPAAALNLADAFDAAFDDLEDMPEKYQLVQDERLAAMGYRKRSVKNYFVFFTIDEINHVVYVERLLHSRRNWQNIL